MDCRCHLRMKRRALIGLLVHAGVDRTGGNGRFEPHLTVSGITRGHIETLIHHTTILITLHFIS